MTLRVFSYGGGVQSTAALVLAAQGKIDFPIFLFCNVGEDSESPESLRYVREVAMPFAAEHGIELHELHREMKDGSTETILGRIHRTAKSEVIPVRHERNGPPMGRSCSADFKRRVSGMWLEAHGATAENPATVGLGFSTDEVERANPARAESHEVLVFPLIDLGLNRNRCETVIANAGLPVPGKSACWFCPFHRLTYWGDLARRRPERFDDAVAIEEHLTCKVGQPVFLTRTGRPLAEIATQVQGSLLDALDALDALDGPEGCDAESCFT